MQNSWHAPEPSPRSGTPVPYLSRRGVSYGSERSASPALSISRPVDLDRLHRPEDCKSFAMTGGLPPSLYMPVPDDALIPSPESSVGIDKDELKRSPSFRLRHGISSLLTRRGSHGPGGRSRTSSRPNTSSEPEQTWIFRRRVHIDDYPEDDDDDDGAVPTVDVNRIPEHLPSSPICPLHPKYHGKRMPGGCPMHGMLQKNGDKTQEGPRKS